MAQTHFSSVIEISANIASGAAISFCLTYWVLPFWGLRPSGGESLQIVAVYTVASFLRQYVWRRVFERGGTG